MTKAQALKTMAKAGHGERAMVRDNRKPSSDETRAAAVTAMEAKYGPRPDPKDRTASREWWGKVIAAKDPLRWESMYYRYEVGYLMPFLGAFLIQGKGDSWEAALKNAAKA